MKFEIRISLYSQPLCIVRTSSEFLSNHRSSIQPSNNIFGVVTSMKLRERECISTAVIFDSIAPVFDKNAILNGKVQICYLAFNYIPVLLQRIIYHFNHFRSLCTLISSHLRCANYCLGTPVGRVMSFYWSRHVQIKTKWAPLVYRGGTIVYLAFHQRVTSSQDEVSYYLHANMT